METHDKVVATLKFLKELGSLKTKIVKDIKEEKWALFLDKLPEGTDEITLNYRDRVDDEEEDISSVLLSVHNPTLSEGPKPPENIHRWLDANSWNFAKKKPEPKKMLVRRDKEGNPLQDENGNTLFDIFSDNPKRVYSYQTWIKKWEVWAEEEIKAESVRDLFRNLYSMYTELKQDKETLELMIGNGILIDSTDQSVKYPILSKRVRIDFNPERNIIEICDTDLESEINTLLLSNLDMVNHDAVRELQRKFVEKGYHPLDRVDTPIFLQGAIQSFCADSRFLKEGESIPVGTTDTLFLQQRPVLFLRKRTDGIVQFLDTMIDDIEAGGEIPAPLNDIVGANTPRTNDESREVTLEQQLAEVGGEDSEILLTKPANREQLEIARQISKQDAVIVQGPPGTGKTHTIANLMGHFLSLGNSVLVTSYTPKALSVLKDKLPEALQNLCVSIIDDSREDMERSIDGITEYMSQNRSEDILRKAVAAEEERKIITDELAEVRKKIYAIKFREYKQLTYNGEGISLEDAVRFVHLHNDELEYIPGQIQTGAPLPLSFEELVHLYQSNTQISVDEQKELEADLPNPKKIISPEEFRVVLKQHETLCSQIKEACAKINGNAKLVMQHDESTPANLSLVVSREEGDIKLYIAEAKALEELQNYVATIDKVDDWNIAVAADGVRGAGPRQRWEKLRDTIINTCNYADKFSNLLFGKNIAIDADIDLRQLRIVLPEMKSLYKENGKIPWLKRLFNSKYQRASDGVQINGSPMDSAEKCDTVMEFLNLRDMRNECGTYWNDLLKGKTIPRFEELGNGIEPERVARNITDKITHWLNWYSEDFHNLCSLMKRSGMDPEAIFIHNDFDDDTVRIQKILTKFNTILPILIAIQKNSIELSNVNKRLDSISNTLETIASQGSTLCMQLRDAGLAQDMNLYKELYYKIDTIYKKYTLQHNRKAYLERLYTVAPTWANAIQNRKGDYGNSNVPENIIDIWRAKQYNQMIEDIISQPFEELQRRSLELSQKYREVTGKLAEYRSWAHLLQRVEADTSMQQSLQGWKQVTKKIGRGTGKRVSKYRAEAKTLMSKCQKAVPVWIMTLNSVINTMSPRDNKFDVVIIDEASQADITALGLMYFAKKIIIVGDDKQVSPMAIGLDMAKMDALVDMYIKDRIPNWTLYTGDTSFYDIASTICHPLMLHEHFRCVPDIINFCNRLCYDGKIKPLRDTSTCNLLPAVVNYRVDGHRSPDGKTNEVEADTVVALIHSMIQLPEYKNKTIGVISLLGKDQAKLIKEKLLRAIEPADSEHHQIICGDAAQFQGDERDVIILTMVDSNEKDSPLYLRNPETNDNYKRYNVAVSRARDQLFVVHSLDPNKDLKNNDIRKQLLDYAANPHALQNAYEQIKRNADSPFEEAVAKALVAKGYQVDQQWPVGNYRIDMVVSDEKGRIALECDGERWHSGETKIREDMERQTILERLGWRFIRLRGSEYYSNPEKAMQHVYDTLDEFGIQPFSKHKETVEISTELLDRVKQGCWECMNQNKTDNLIENDQKVSEI